MCRSELAAEIRRVGELEESLGESNAQLEASKAENEAVKVVCGTELCVLVPSVVCWY